MNGRTRGVLSAVLTSFAAVLLAGCAAEGGGNGLVGSAACEDPEEYAGAASADPLQVPAHLSPPDEGQALWIPPEPVGEPEPIARLGDCLESPPLFFESDDGEDPLSG